MIRFKRATFSLLSPMIGLHIGKNPVSGQRFMHLAPVPFVGLDFEIGPHIEGTYVQMNVDKESIAKAIKNARYERRPQH